MNIKVKPRKKTVQAWQAEALGVTRVHLSYVVHGHRQSRSLMRRWRELKANTKAPKDPSTQIPNGKGGGR